MLTALAPESEMHFGVVVQSAVEICPLEGREK
jgi:hypothetical protein